MAGKEYPVFEIETERVVLPVNIDRKIDKFEDNMDVDEIDVEIKEKEIKKKLNNAMTTVVWLLTINELSKLEFIDSSRVTCHY